jgi:hypothetical protein
MHDFFPGSKPQRDQLPYIRRTDGPANPRAHACDSDCANPTEALSNPSRLPVSACPLSLLLLLRLTPHVVMTLKRGVSVARNIKRLQQPLSHRRHPSFSVVTQKCSAPPSTLHSNLLPTSDSHPNEHCQARFGQPPGGMAPPPPTPTASHRPCGH